MSISNLFIDNDYQLVCDSIEVKNEFVARDIFVGGQVLNNLTIQRDLNVGEDVNVTQHLNVTGESTLTEDVTLSNNLIVTGSTSTASLILGTSPYGVSEDAVMQLYISNVASVDYNCKFIRFAGYVFLSFLSKARVDVQDGFGPFFSQVPEEFRPLPVPDDPNPPIPGISVTNLALIATNSGNTLSSGTVAIVGGVWSIVFPPIVAGAGFSFDVSVGRKITLIYAL